MHSASYQCLIILFPVRSDKCVIIHIVICWTLTNMLDTSSLNMEFHQQNVLVFDVHFFCLFLL